MFKKNENVVFNLYNNSGSIKVNTYKLYYYLQSFTTALI